MGLTDDKVFYNGTEVLVFKYVFGWKEQNMENFIKGRIIKGEISGDLSYHGSPWYVMNYTVLGEDGNQYFGNMKHHVIGDHFFMTREMYIEYLNNKIKNNILRIDDLNKENIEIKKRIEEINTMEEANDIEPSKTRIYSKK